jgi:group II intron reverse transcriptase/maturase
MQTILWKISNKAAQDKSHRFTGLYSLLNEHTLLWCFEQLNKNAASGVDGVSYSDYKENLEENVKALTDRLRRKGYKARFVKRKRIPKSGNKERILGIPQIEDKMLQYGASKILEAIYEQDFMFYSYGYRPKHNAGDALDYLRTSIQKGNYGWIVDTDIKGFFDNISHDWVVRMLSERVNDKAFIRLIQKWMKAGILEEDGQVIHPNTGCPQGGVISPVISNIYLHYALDLWFDRRVKSQCRGECLMVRYADDCVYAFRYKEDALYFYQSLKDRLKKFSLELSEEKTKMLRFTRFQTVKGEAFTFLGFEFRWEIGKSGYPMVTTKTSRKKLYEGINKFRDWIKKNRHMKISLLMKIICSKYRGYWNYYCRRGNFRSVEIYFYHTKRILLKWLNRRSQRKSYNWKGFYQLLKWFGVPKPCIITKPEQMKLDLT